ncbi:hypothetical protein QBC47DRAFT_325380 [Echria macrotheca]|uniref:L-ascorbate oxidase n=1 Tax=Echria macrotheca TaxID=438768 RepID=A0AAJ0BBX8_9PEZI|nr:hypothetical protein QBC47DRAFT_325380 [Echria macrotheca]
MHRDFLSWLLSVALFAAGALAEFKIHDSSFVPDHVLRVSYAVYSSGCSSRKSVVVNGTIPGPPLYLEPGHISWIRVYNDIPDQNLTMHWHGLAQRMAPFSDGTPQASQWPIPPGHFFDYEINVFPEDAGTYFYHSHVNFQAMSAAGPLIVTDCAPSPFAYDDERVLFFMDHFLQSRRKHEAVSGIILNGKGVASEDLVRVGRPGGKRGFFGSDLERRTRQCRSIREAPDCSLPVIDVEPGKTYRFRFICGTGLSMLGMGFEHHDNLTIIQADGSEYNAPISTSYIQLASGQRFDVLFRAKTVQELRAAGGKSTFYLQFETLERPRPYRGYAVLRYNTRSVIPLPPPSPPIHFPEDIENWFEYTLQPLFPNTSQAPSASEVTRRIVLDTELVLDNATGMGVAWKIGGLSWTEHTWKTPALVDIYKHGDAVIPDLSVAEKNNGWDPRTLSFPARIGEVLEVVWQNTGTTIGGTGHVEVHPMHGHSKQFYDVGSGRGRYDPDANNAKLERLGYKPVMRDTTMLYRFADGARPGEVSGWRAWRIRVENPGVWMIHCHVLGHMRMGMQTVWVVGTADEIRQIPAPYSQEYLTFGSSVYGSRDHAPGVYHFFHNTSCCPKQKMSKKVE